MTLHRRGLDLAAMRARLLSAAFVISFAAACGSFDMSTFPIAGGEGAAVSMSEKQFTDMVVRLD